jgi:hypothetical protein
MNSDSTFDQELDADVVVPADAVSKPEPPARPVETVDDFKARLASLPLHDLEALIRMLKTPDK